MSPVQHRPAGRPDGGQFAPGDASRDSAGQVDLGGDTVVQRVSDHFDEEFTSYHNDYDEVSFDSYYADECNELMASGSEIGLMEKWEQAHEEAIEASRTQAIASAAEQAGVNDLTDDDIDELHLILSERDDMRAFDERLARTTTTASVSMGEVGPGNSLHDIAAGLGANLHDPRVRSTLDRADGIEGEVELQFDANLRDIGDAVRNGEPRRFRARLVVDGSHVDIGEVERSFGQYEVRPVPGESSWNGTGPEASDMRDRFGLDLGTVTKTEGSTTYYSDRRKVTVNGNFAFEESGSRTTEVALRPDGTRSTLTTSMGDNFRIVDTEEVRPDGTFTRSRVETNPITGPIRHERTESLDKGGVLRSARSDAAGNSSLVEHHPGGLVETTESTPYLMRRTTTSDSEYLSMEVSDAGELHRRLEVEDDSVTGTWDVGPNRHLMVSATRHDSGRVSVTTVGRDGAETHSELWPDRTAQLPVVIAEHLEETTR